MTVVSDSNRVDELLGALAEQLAADGKPIELVVDRLEHRRYGDVLTVHFASRLDQIHFKLYALVDQGARKHESDLRALRSAPGELLQAAHWAREHDPSEGFYQELAKTLAYLGVEDANLGS